MNGQMNIWVPNFVPISRKRKASIRLSLLPCRPSLMCGGGSQIGSRVRLKWEKLIRESSKSGEDEKG